MTEFAEYLEAVSDILVAKKDVGAPETINPFRFISSKETTLSQIIAWLLNPSADHGAGASLLKLFTETFGLPDLPDDCSGYRASCEHRTFEQRSIDIVLLGSGYSIAIENKPYSSFSEMQLPHYWEHMVTLGKPFALVALKGWVGVLPDDQCCGPVSDDRSLVDADYRTLLVWLDACLSLSLREDLRIFIRQFREFLALNVLGDASLDTTNAIVAKAMSAPEMARAALAVGQSMQQIERRLHDGLVDRLSHAVRDLGWTVSNEPSLRVGRTQSSYYYLTVDFDRSWPVVGGIEYVSGSGEPFCGVYRRPDLRLSERRAKEVWQHLDSSLFETAQGGNTDCLWWAQLRHFPETVWPVSYQNAWNEIVEAGAFEQALLEMFTKIEAALSQVMID